MKYKCFIRQEAWNDSADMFLLGYNETNDYSSFFTIEDGRLLSYKVEVGMEPAKPLFSITGQELRFVFPAIVEGLKKAGYVAEVDNAQRIASEATVKEMKEQIDWLRIQIEKQL